MGLFKRSEKPIFMESGELWDPSVTSNEEIFLYDSKKRKRLGIHPNDVQSYSEASYAYSIGLAKKYKILAWGPIETAGFPENYNKLQGTGVVTKECVLLWWLPSPIKKIEVFVAAHSDLLNIDPDENGWGGWFTYSRGYYSDQMGKKPISEVEIGIGTRLGKNGHDNRRSMTFFKTLAEATRRTL